MRTANTDQTGWMSRLIRVFAGRIPFKESTPMTDQTVDAQGTRKYVEFALTLLMFFFSCFFFPCYIDDFTVRSTLLYLYRAVYPESLRRNGKPVK